ncbi:MAG: AmmeMemoRadiSam system protein B [Bowdeniella nasicola]|nr:AmmeMemoRadiSam system protein B [Bowdeniella nasicola]
MVSTRPPAVAGLFYPSDTSELKDVVDHALSAAQPAPLTSRAVISPHAGYLYSGGLAARAISCLPHSTRRVLILGPTHRVGIDAMALAGVEAHATPLGDIPTDPDLTEAIAAHPAVVTAPVVHAQEHSLEVQLPFLQRHLTSPFTIVPLAVGRVDPDSVADVIEIAWEDPHSAVIVSSDLSHYLSYALARAVDDDTLRHIVTLDGPIPTDRACGAYPVSGLMTFARRASLELTVLDVASSGDTAGDRERVVGYAALAARDASALPALAYNAIAAELDAPLRPVPEDATDHRKHGATFVTLTRGGELRGCIGSLRAHRPLLDDVRANARSAAFADPRFPPLRATDLDQIDVEVSLLGEPTALPGSPGLTRAEVEAALRPRLDGVVLSHGSRRSTFLPQVWDQLPESRDFLSHLLTKGGWRADSWDPRILVETYPVTSHHLAR